MKKDIVERLREASGYAIMDAARVTVLEAAEEIERLREAIRRLAEQDATLSLLCKRDGSQVVTVTMDGTLTDAEREAVEVAIRTVDWTAQRHTHAATLRGLLERLK